MPVVVKLVNRFIDLFNQSELLRGTIAGIKTAFKIAFIAIKSQIDQAINVFSTFANLIVEFADKGIAGEFGKVISDGFEAGKDIAKKAGEDIGKAMADGVNETLNKRLEHISESGIKTSLSEFKDKVLDSVNILGSGDTTPTMPDETLTSDGGEDDNINDKIQKLNSFQQAVFDLQEQLRNSSNVTDQFMGTLLALGTGAAITGEQIKGSFSAMGASIAQSLGMGETAMGTFVGTLIKSAMTQIGTSLAATMATGAQAAGQTALSFGPLASFVLPALLAASAVAVKGAFSKIKAPAKFASGGIVSAPTMGLVGEYPGARSNPEVIAPLDKLKGMIGDRGTSKVEVGGSFTLKGQDLVVALQRANSNRNRIL